MTVGMVLCGSLGGGQQDDEAQAATPSGDDDAGDDWGPGLDGGDVGLPW